MKYQARKEGSLTIVEIQGNMVGGPAADSFREFMLALIDNGARKVILDLSRVPYASSPGAGMIIGTHSTLTKRGGELKLVIATQRVKNLVNLIQLYRIMEIYETLEEAIASFEEPREGRPKPAATVESTQRAMIKRDEAVSAG